MFLFSIDSSPPKAGEQCIITSPWGQCVCFLPAFLFPLMSLSSQFLSSVCYFGLSLSHWRLSSNIRQYLEEVLKFNFVWVSGACWLAVFTIGWLSSELNVNISGSLSTNSCKSLLYSCLGSLLVNPCISYLAIRQPVEMWGLGPAVLQAFT